jgi:hypothetical protein
MSRNTRPTLCVSPVRQRRIWNALASGIAIMSDSSIRLKPRTSCCAIANDLSCSKLSVS